MLSFLCTCLLLFGKEGGGFKTVFVGYLCWVPFLIVFISNIKEKKLKKSLSFYHDAC